MTNKYLTFVFFALLLFSSCDDKTADPVLSLGASPVLTSPTAGTEFVLNEAQQDDVLTNFDWSAADFGYQAAITYSLEIDVVGNNFAEAVQLASTIDLNTNDLTVGKINNILLAKGLPFGFANPLEIRVCAKVSDEVSLLCSEPVAITVNPYAADIVYPKLTVPGDYQGWEPADENFAVYSRKSDDIYEGYIYFPTDMAVYKFAQGLSWDINWGDNEPDGVLDSGGIDNNIQIMDGAGVYQLKANLNDLTHSNLKTDWGVLGDATPTGWNSDTDLSWDDTKGALTITMDLSVGVFRFRANDTSDVNFGDDFTNGTLEADGEDIPVTEAGNYTIDLFLNVADYAYTITKN